MVDPGFLFMFGIYGKKASRRTVQLLKKSGASGVLLLARNIETAEQTRALTEELTQRLGRPLLFAVDHEGGWVLRFKSGVTAFPGNAALGMAKDPNFAYAVGRTMARELSRLGIAVNLAPVLDVTAGYNPGIGMRSFGSDPRLVSKLGKAMIAGMQEHGLSACAKHFPGKGAARVDAHVQLPSIRLPRAKFNKVHLAPFKAAVDAGVDSVMTSHVRFAGLDSVPATFSKKITEGILRRDLGFDGAVISDDLCMGAIAGRWPIQVAAVKALHAGHDVLMIAHNEQIQEEAAQLLSCQLSEGAVTPEQIERAAARINKLFGRARYRGAAPAPADALSDKIARRAVRVTQKGSLPLPLKPDGRPPLVLLPDFAEVNALFTFEGGLRGPENLVKKIAANWGLIRLRLAPIQSTELGSLPAEVNRASRILFFCFEARRFPGQNKVLSLLKKSAPGRTVLCLIRSSFDGENLDPRLTVLDAKGYRLSSLKAAMKMALGALLLLAPVWPAGAQVTAPISVVELRRQFVESAEKSKKAELLAIISQTPPATAQDVQSLYDLFSRFSRPDVRKAVIGSLHKLGPNSIHLEPAFLAYFDQQEAEDLLFAINGALMIRAPKALPLLYKIAKRKFPGRRVEDLDLISEKNSWWTQYDALSALAQWEGAKVLPLLKSKADKAPAVARIMTAFLWKESLPQIKAWASSGSERDKEKAQEALSADADPAALRQTRDEMLKIMRDNSAHGELRHQLALKIGMTSTEEEVTGLLKEHQESKEAHTRLLLNACLFASRSPQTVPLLKNYARENPVARAGVLAQLKTMLSPADYEDFLRQLKPNP